MGKQIPGFSGAGDFFANVFLIVIRDALREAKGLGASVRAHSMEMRTSKVTNATILLVHRVKRHLHGEGMARLQHEELAILVGWGGLAHARWFVEVLEVLRDHGFTQ